MVRSSIGRGLGCLAVLPAAFIGLAGLTDGIGPTGWRGFAELFGWVAVCVAASYCLGFLLTPQGWPKAWRYLTGVSIAVALTFTVNWLGLSAPMEAKIAFTSTLQIIGVVAAIGCLALIAYFAKDGRQEH
ncbi:hypothetical protein GCM10009102_06240 [Sphingomonas insulae]|uniref:SPW repeat-containing protein n=1 Tax=Sphingomonas insulae TaxID=424800 RepID=A0ABN1HNH4_9SPHN